MKPSQSSKIWCTEIWSIDAPKSLSNFDFISNWRLWGLKISFRGIWATESVWYFYQIFCEQYRALKLYWSCNFSHKPLRIGQAVGVLIDICGNFQRDCHSFENWEGFLPINCFSGISIKLYALNWDENEQFWRFMKGKIV